MPLLQGVIFDLDGTLVNSAPDLRHAVNATLRTHNRRPMTEAEVESMIGDGMLTLLGRAFAATGTAIPDSESYARFQEFIAHYRNMSPDQSQIYPHTVQTLQTLHKAGIKLGICTNKQEAATIYLLDELKLRHYFTFIAGSDTFTVHKPNPGHVTGVIEHLGVPASGCVMVGDGPHDVSAARGAGIPCLVVTHGYGGDFGSLGGTALIAGFHELLPAIEKLGFEINRANV